MLREEQGDVGGCRGNRQLRVPGCCRNPQMLQARVCWAPGLWHRPLCPTHSVQIQSHRSAESLESCSTGLDLQSRQSELLPGLFRNNDLVSLLFERVHFVLTFLTAWWISPEARLASWFRAGWKSSSEFGSWTENCLNVRGTWLIWEVIDEFN